MYDGISMGDDWRCSCGTAGTGGAGSLDEEFFPRPLARDGIRFVGRPSTALGIPWPMGVGGGPDPADDGPATALGDGSLWAAAAAALLASMAAV
jgi:hypothetical protein